MNQDRRTMLLQAVRYAANGQTVIIVAKTYATANMLAERVHDAAKLLGADAAPSVIAATEATLEQETRNRRAKVFTDKAVWGRGT